MCKYSPLSQPMSVYSSRPLCTSGPIAALDGADTARALPLTLPPRQIPSRTGAQMGRPLRHSDSRVAELEEMERELQMHALPRKVVHSGQTPGHIPPTKPPQGEYSAAKAQITGMGGLLRGVSPSKRTMQIRSSATSRYHISKVKETLRPRNELEEAEKKTSEEEAAYRAFKKRNFHVL
jgi:hypothetical protein